MKRLLLLLAPAILVTPCLADNITYMRVDRGLIQEHLKLAHDGEAERIRTLRSVLQKGGCPQVIEQTVPKEEFPNLICLLPGEEEGTIIVGASLDYEPEDPNTPSQWGAAAMLPLLAESLSLVPHRFTVMLIAFTGHEHGMRGATWYLSQLTESQRKPIKAMISLDSLGRTPAVYALTQPDRTLATWLQVAAVSLQIPNPPQVDASTASQSLQNGLLAVKDEDLWAEAKPFEHDHIPAIAIQSATPAMLPSLWRSGGIPNRFTGTAFDMDAFEDTYRLLAVYVLYLDRNLGRTPIEPGIYTGKLVDTAGVFPSSPLDVSVKIDHFTGTDDLFRYERILQDRGQDGLAEALGNDSLKGTYRFGLNLAYSIKIAMLQNSGKTPSVLLVGTRLKPKASTPRDFRFTAIKLTLDSKGTGSGLFYNSVQLRFNKKHELEINESNSNADDIRQVRLEPKLPTTTPTTALVAATTPAAASAPATSATPTASTGGVSSPVPVVLIASANPPQEVSPAQPPATTPDAGTTPTFRSQARLVQLDVAVTDSNGRPIAGLQQSDFTVLEDGKPQEIRVFEPHTPATKQATASAAAPSVPLPPHTFTNRVATPPDGPLSILLLDLWNTPVTDQAYARKQTIEFLKTLPKGRTISMFVLGTKLVMVQGFTDDSSALVASAEKVMNERSLLLRSDAERQQFQGEVENVGRNAMPGGLPAQAPPSAVANANGGGSLDFGSAQARLRTETNMQADRTAERVYTTLDALSALARAVSSYPGRKNLIWLSGSFPVRLKPSAADVTQLSLGSTSQTSGLASAPNFPAALRVTTQALATARIAVYPIDLRGVQTSGVDITIGTAEGVSFAGTDNPTAYKDNLNIQSATRYEERSAMKEVAEQTGGEVLAGNDLKKSMGRAIEDGSTYYALAYTPARAETGQEFRKIDVKLNRAGLKLAYRPGYFPNGKQEGAAPKTHPLIVAMQPGVPPSTVIPLTVEVLPPDNTNKKTKITYTIDIRGIEFADTAEHRKRAVIDCIAVAFTKEGAPVGQISNTWDATLPVADYEAALRAGLVVPQELELPPGEYILRLGVMEHGSQKIGTLDAPLAVVAVK